MRTTQRYDLGTLSSATNTLMVACRDFRNAVITVVSTAATLTANVYGSTSPIDVRPDLSSAASDANQYSPVQSVDLNDGSKKDGTTGIGLTASTAVRLYEVNTNGLGYIGVDVSAYTSGSVTLYIDLYDNQ